MSGRSSLKVHIGRIVQKLPLWVLRFIELPFVVAPRSKLNIKPEVFIFALPRSGSTVTYQSVCHGLAVNYLSNSWNTFYQLPLIGGWLSLKKAQYHHSNFMSRHGFVDGFDGPAEGLCFWRWWLDCGLTDKECATVSPALLEKRTRYIRKVFAFLSFKGPPFVSAFLGHSLLPDRVFQFFPGAVLIRLKREPVSNALSLLNSRRLNNSDWFSLKPRECEELQTLTEHEQVAAQVYWLNRRLDDAICFDQMFVVHYEDLCENPGREVERIRKFCCEKGLPIAQKFKLPAAFQFKKADFYLDRDAIAIREALDALEKKYGKLKVT